jgi:cell wall-associated NlpC family hydrolase
LGFIKNGSKGRGYPLVGGKAPVANWLGDAKDTQHLTNLGIITDGKLKPGDIVAWRANGGSDPGHSTIYIGGNVLVYAGGSGVNGWPNGTPQAQTLTNVNSKFYGHIHATTEGWASRKAGSVHTDKGE